MQPISNYFYKILTQIHRFCLRCIGASTVGVRALVINKNNQVLLVKHTYSVGWYFPGGGVKSDETTKDAIIRELKEEAGVYVTGPMEFFGIYFHRCHGVNDYPILYIVNDFELKPIKQSPEIAAIHWFEFTDLPRDISPSTQRRIREYLNQADLIDAW